VPHVAMVLSSLDADYQLDGGTQALTERARIRLAAPDAQRMCQHNRSLLSPEFKAFVKRQQAPT